MRKQNITIGKIGYGQVCEDASISVPGMAAVSDGAGGGGLFADEWARYLLKHLDTTKPITTFEQLDVWIDGFWETFYDTYLEKARQADVMLYDKFLDEGAFATLATVWKRDEQSVSWMTYGDSVVFCYHQRSGILEHSFTSLSDFSKAPFLINCKDPLVPEGFRCGSFALESEHDVVFVCSDALSFYVMMMYEITHPEQYVSELERVRATHSRQCNYLLKAQLQPKLDFSKCLKTLLNCCGHGRNFERHIQSLLAKQLIAEDDYSLAILMQ